MKQFRFSFTTLMKIIVDPILNALVCLTDKHRGTPRNTTLHLTGDVSADIPILNEDIATDFESDITANVNVVDYSHRHNTTQIESFIDGSPSTIAKRDSSGGIVSRSNTRDTGYVLADGRDIGDILAAKTDPFFTTKENVTIRPANPSTLGTSIVVQDAFLRNEGNKLYLEIHSIRYCG